MKKIDIINEYAYKYNSSKLYKMNKDLVPITFELSSIIDEKHYYKYFSETFKNTNLEKDTKYASMQMPQINENIPCPIYGACMDMNRNYITGFNMTLQQPIHCLDTSINKIGIHFNCMNMLPISAFR